MIYLSEAEINTYCTVPGVTTNEVAYASLLISSYIGDISEKQVTKQVVLNRKNKGKLEYVSSSIPLVSIDEVKGVYRTQFGIVYQDVNVNDILLDDAYFEYYPSANPYVQIYNVNPYALQIKYTVGYKDTEVPEDLKRACAMIAMGAKKRGYDPLKSISDLDVKLEFTSDSLITQDVRMVLNKYRGA